MNQDAGQNLGTEAYFSNLHVHQKSIRQQPLCSLCFNIYRSQKQHDDDFDMTVKHQDSNPLK